METRKMSWYRLREQQAAALRRTRRIFPTTATRADTVRGQKIVLQYCDASGRRTQNTGRRVVFLTSPDEDASADRSLHHAAIRKAYQA